MQLTVITNDDPSRGVIYKLARVLYAETGGTSLFDVEALGAMVANLHAASGRSFEDIAGDIDLFESLDPASARHEFLNVDINSRAFEMCLRVVGTMMRGHLGDCVRGATRFHRSEMLPSWAINRGYILDTGQLTFYL